MFNPATINLISKKNKTVSTDMLANRIYQENICQGGFHQFSSKIYLSILKSSVKIYSHIHHSSPIATRCYILLRDSDIDQQAQKMMDTIIQQMVEAQGITEALKIADPMAWVGQMNNIYECAREIVNTDVILL